MLSQLPLGLYEKAMPSSFSWEQKCRAAKEAGYDFIEMSIDPSPEKLERLNWTDRELYDLRRILEKENVPVYTVALSANREYPLGSPDDSKREMGVMLVKKTIDLASKLGIRIIQLASYDAFAEPGTARTRENFRESILRCVDFAAQKAVTLAFETMDTDFIDTIEKAMSHVAEVDSPYLQVYADVGNIAAMGNLFSEDAQTGQRHIVAIHLKDSLPKIVRRVPYGEGLVNFERDFRALKQIKYRGLFVAEMWCDDDPRFAPYLREAWRFLKEKMRIADCSQI